MKTVFEKIEDYRKGKANVLVPSVLFEDPHGIFEPVLEVIQLSPSPEDKDVYSSNGSKPRLTSLALSKIAQCGGTEWDASQSCYTHLERGKYCTYKAVGGIRKADGRLCQMAAMYTVDLDVIHDDLIEQYTKTAAKQGKKDDYIQFCVARDMRQKNKFMLQLAETGARNRVIRAVFSLKNEYSNEELSKPFIMLRYRLRIDYSDPEIRRIAQTSAIQAALGIFGPMATRQQPQLPAPEPVPVPEDKNEHDDLTGSGDIPMGADPEADGLPSGEPTEREIFESYDKETKIRTLKEMSARKGYDLSTLKTPMESWTAGYLMGFHDKLAALPDQKEAA